MRFGGKVDNGVGLVFRDQGVNHHTIADVPLNEAIFRMGSDGFEVFKIAGISQLINYEHISSVLRQRETDKCGADEACSAGDEKFHSYIVPPRINTDRPAISPLMRSL